MATGGLTDAQMAGGEAEEGGPESFLDPKKFKPSKGQRKFKNQTGPIEQVREDIRHEKTLYPTESADIIAAPGLSMLDRASLGGLTGTMRLSNRINEAAGREPLFQRSLDAIEGYRGNSPTLSRYTDIGGYLTGGPQAIATSVERAIPQVAGALPNIARATVASGAAGGLTAGAESATRGDDTAEFLRETGRGAAGGALVGAPLSIGSTLIGKAAQAVLNSKGAKAREYLTARGKPLTAPDTSDAAIGASAQRADDAVKEGLTAYRNEVASEPYQQAIERVKANDVIRQRLGLEPEATKLVDVTPIFHDMIQSYYTPGLDAGTAAFLKRELEIMEQRFMRPDGTVKMTQEGVNQLRRGFSGNVDFNRTDNPQALVSAYGAAKKIVDQGPFAEANRLFSEGDKNYRESLDMLNLRKTNRRDQPIQGNLRVAAQRQGQNTVTAGADTERLDRDAFAQKHPELAARLEEPEILRNQGDLKFNLLPPSHGGLIERLAAPAGLGAAAVAQGFGHGASGVAGLLAALALQNKTAIAGRLLYDPAIEARLAAQMMLGAVPQVATPGEQLVPQERR